MNQPMPFTAIRNGQAIPLAHVPLLPFEAFRGAIVEAAAAGQRVAAFFGHPSALNTNVNPIIRQANKNKNDF